MILHEITVISTIENKMFFFSLFLHLDSDKLIPAYIK